MSRLSLRVYPLGEYESVTDDALRDMVGQTVTSHVRGALFVGKVLDAVVRDGWVEVTTDIDFDEATTLDLFDAAGGEYSLGYRFTPPSFVQDAWLRASEREPSEFAFTNPPEEMILPDWARATPKPTAPDWSTVPGAVGGPARFERTLGRGLAPTADAQWWSNRMADSNREWLVGPEFSLPAGFQTRQ